METLSSLLLGIKIPHDSLRKVELQSVNLEGNVDQVRIEAIRETGLATDQILLIYAGVALQDNCALKSYGIIAGCMIHVLKKKEIEKPPAPKKMTDTDIQQLALAFRTVALNASFRSTLNRLSRPEMLENIVMATPGLLQDPAAMAIIRDPELLIHMGDVATVRKVVEKHPALAEAASHIAAAVHEETNAARQNRRGEGTPASSSSALSLDAFSGGEEMDSSQSDSPTPRRGFGITSSQLAAALAAATSPNASGASGSGPSGASGSRTSDSMLITPEMFNSALQQAFQGISMPVPPGESPLASAPTPAARTAEQSSFMMAERMSQQLQQMRELGLRDQMFNLQALQITNGDVQAAIELVMSSTGGTQNDDDDDPYN